MSAFCSGLAYMAQEFGLPITNLAKGIAAAIMFAEDKNEDEAKSY